MSLLEKMWCSTQTDEGCVRILLSALRAQSMLYQNLHWESDGAVAYADHLLYERLYEALQEDVDALAEKSVQMLGGQSVDALTTSMLAHEWLLKWGDGSLVERAILSEDQVLQAAEFLYKILKGRETLSLGMDDFLMSLCNKHEGHLYLLGQRGKRGASQIPSPEEEKVEEPTSELKPNPTLSHQEKGYGGYTVEAPRKYAGWTLCAKEG